MTMMFTCGTNIGWTYLPSIFAASIVGGLSSIYGAILGGYLMGLIEQFGTYILAKLLSPYVPTYMVIQYRPIIPLIAISITLMVFPQGLAGINWRLIITRLRSVILRGV